MKRISVTWLFTAALMCGAGVRVPWAAGQSWRNPYQMPATRVVPSLAPAEAMKRQPAMQQVQVTVTPSVVSPTNETAAAPPEGSAKGAQEAKAADESPSANAGPNPILLDHPSSLSGSGDSPYYEAQG